MRGELKNIPMKPVAVFLACLLAGFVHSQTQQQLQAALPDAILQKASAVLGSLKKLKYDNKRELNYASNNYRYTSLWTCYYNFETTDTTAGFIYQVEDSVSKSIFNGSEYFNLNKPDKEIEIIERPQRYDVTALSFTYNSLITLRNILPLLIKDNATEKSVSDTLIHAKNYYLLRLNIGKRRIKNWGKGFDSMKTPFNFIYKIIIDKSNYLPYMVVQMNDADNDFIKTTFSSIDTNPAEPLPASWYYSTYTAAYKKTGEKKRTPLIQVGVQAPGWELNDNIGNNKKSLSSLKGKVVLIDFWIKNCGACIQSVPQMNELHEKFKNKKFEVIGINAYDTKNDVNWFSNKYNIDYPVLLNGKPVAEKYGVNGFPAFILIDKKGKVVYTAEGYSPAVKTELEKLMKEML